MAMRPDSRSFKSEDGLDLHYLDFAPRIDDRRPPAVCLPGLTRGAADFTSLAEALASDATSPRRVIAFDYRGRGRSAHDPDWRHYDLGTERADVLKGLAQLGVGATHWIGTSRGGLHVMALATIRPDLICSAVLNDIGPKIEEDGLLRIKGYVGRMVRPRSIDEAIKLLKVGAGEHFDGLSPAEWRIFATTTFGDDEANLHLAYDPAIARTLDAVSPGHSLPEVWDQFDCLRDRPVLTIRGERSDLLSPGTFAQMGARWPASETFVVPGQGHAPLLADQSTIEYTCQFLRRADCTMTR